MTAGDAPNDLMDQRDVLLDRLSTLGTTSIVKNADGSVDVTFGGAGAPMIDGAGYHAEPLGTNPGGRLGALKELSTVPGGLIDSYRTELGAVAQTLAASVNAIHPGFFSVSHAPPASYGAASLAVAVDNRTLLAGTTPGASANERARAVSELSGKAPDTAYNAFISRVGSEVRESLRNEANAQALTDAVQDRRESVAGVSLDEEMGNMIRFQRAYQASSRAMSTMDEMLDVLDQPHRTGRALMSARITTGMTQRNVLADLNRVNDRLTRSQQKIASNKEITRPSDDPFNTSRALALRTSMEGTQQYQRNIQDAQGWQETAEIALADITDAIHRAHELVVEGASGTTPAEARLAIASEIDQLIESVKENGNATYRGRYVFAGTATDAPPYVAGDDAYHGSTDEVERQIGPGVGLPIGQLGSSFLGNGGDGKLLQVLRDVSAHLKADDGAGAHAPTSRSSTPRRTSCSAPAR